MVRRLICRGLIWAAVVGVGLVPSVTLAQDETVQGFVADAATFELIPSATIVLVETDGETQTGPDGSFSLADAPAGPISVRVSAPGYQGVLWETEVVAGRPLFLEVFLTRLEGNSSLVMVVTDEESGDPVAGAEVSLPELALSATTNEEGEARIEQIPTGNWLVVVSGFAYASAQSFITFDGDSTAEGEVALAEGPIYLEGLTITAEMRSRELEEVGFYTRERQGFGYHYDPLQIDEMVATVPSDLLRGVPGLWELQRAEQRSRSGAISGALEPRACPPDARTCVPGPQNQCPALYVEGHPWGGHMDDLTLGWIEGIEVFTRNSSTPLQFGGTNGACGAILIWLK
jgi:hypothetical protein